MAIYRGPSIVKDGLVFGYDADDRSSRFYRGEPTTNLTLDTIIMNGWQGNYSLVNSSTKTFNITVVANGAPTTNSAWRTFYWNVNSYIGQYITISANITLINETNCIFSSITIGQGNTGTYPYYILGSLTSDKIIITSRPNNTYISWSGVINSTGVVGFCLQNISATVNTASCTIQLSNVQIEQKSHATQFINGTRSVTESLIDLKKTTTIDLSNISFDSTAHPIFDGIDDVIRLSYAPQFGDFSVCLIFKDNGSGGFARIVDKQYDTGFFISSYFSTFGANYVGAGIIEPSPPHGIALLYEAGKYHFFASVRNGTTHTIYLDGITKTNTKTVSSALLSPVNFAFGSWSSSNNQLFKGSLPVVTIYNRALTEQEIEQNYNAYKNRYDIV